MGHFSGRSCAFPGDLPCQEPFSRKVLRFSGGPSMLEAIFPEGPALFRGTFHARSHFPGRSCAFPGDLPCQRPFSRKVLRFSGGPSMPEADFMEGRCFFMGTFHARGRFPGRSCVFQGDLPCQGPFSRKVRERVGERVGEKDCTVAGMDPFLTIWHGNIGKKFDLAVWHRQKEYNPAGGRWQKVCDSGRD